MEIKYKIKEVADDFAMPAKDVIEAIGKFFPKPKSSSQNLSEEQLNVVFDYITQNHQISSLEEVFAAAKPKEAPAESAPAPQPQSAQPSPAAQQKPQSAPAQKPAAPAQRPAQNAPAAQQKPQTQPRPQPSAQPSAKPQSQPQPERKRERRVIDTSAVTVNADRYDDRVDSLVSERVQNYQSGKQKIGNKNKKQQAKKFGSKTRSEEQEKMRRLQLEIAKKAQLVVKIPDEITVGELASRMKKTAVEVIKCLLKNGVMATVNQTIDFDTAEFVAVDLGCKVEREVVVTIEEKLFDDHEDTADELVTRPPVVVVMGHVDHGKTSLLDYVRHAKVAAGEAGGITQHIGAYTVKINGQPITFLDTPGHAAFTEMRARGAMCTDIAILVVAADDGIMPQTIEAINHAKAAGVQTIVAINKMDKPTADPDRIRQELTKYELVDEAWGGDTIIVPVSAQTGQGVDQLLEMILLVAEVQDYRANPNRKARGIIIEARLDKGRGPVANVLIKNGTLRVGDTIVAGMAYGRVRAMVNDKGERVKEARPSDPVEVIGFNDVPEAGDILSAVDDDSLSRKVAEERRDKARAALIKAQSKTTLDDLFNQISEGQVKELNIIIKADVQGSVEAVKQSLERLSNDEVKVKVIHGGVGAITETDVNLASASNAIIIGFNVRHDNNVRDLAEHEKVDIRLYRVIYNAIEDIQAAMKGMLAPKFKENVLGRCTVRQTFRVSGVGTVAGCYVTDGKIQRNAQIRLLRDNVVVHEGKIDSLKRFKDDAKEVAAGYECGLGIENYNDVKEGDEIECFVMEEISR